MGKWSQYMPPAIAAIGTAMYGIDTGIIATTIAHESFNCHMFPPDCNDDTLTGAVVSVYNAGQAVGTIFSGWTADRYSRRYTLALACAIAIVGIVLSVVGSNAGMFLAGRLLTGWSSGMLLPVVAVYIAEVSKPRSRGVVVGFQGLGTAVGFCLANWIGYLGAVAFAPGSNMQWRFPLIMQLPCAVALLVASVALLPFTPRWLVSRDRFDEARAVLARIHADEGADFVDREMIQIREQIALERSYRRVGGGDGDKWYGNFVLLFTRKYRRRTAWVCFILSLIQFGGVGVIQNYQSIFYATVGFTGNKALLISGIYGFMGLGGQVFNLVCVADKWRRNTTLWVGCLVLCVMLSLCAALSAEFGDGTNAAAARAVIAFIFLYSAMFAVFFNSTVWVVASETLPVFIRSSGMAAGTFAQGVSSIVISQVTPTAIRNIAWRYYIVFIVANAVGAVVYFYWLPDTSGLTLEEIGGLYGDELATARIADIDVDAKLRGGEGPAVVEVENVAAGAGKEA